MHELHKVVSERDAVTQQQVTELKKQLKDKVEQLKNAVSENDILAKQQEQLQQQLEAQSIILVTTQKFFERKG